MEVAETLLVKHGNACVRERDECLVTVQLEYAFLGPLKMADQPVRLGFRIGSKLSHGHLARKESTSDAVPLGVKDDESGAKAHKGPRGKAFPYACWSANESADTMQEFPCLNFETAKS